MNEEYDMKKFWDFTSDSIGFCVFLLGILADFTGFKLILGKTFILVTNPSKKQLSSGPLL